MLPQVRDLLARLLRMRQRLGGLSSHPGDDRNPVVAEDHQRVVRISDDPGQFRLENAVQSGQNRGAVEISFFHVSPSREKFASALAPAHLARGGTKLVNGVGSQTRIIWLRVSAS